MKYAHERDVTVLLSGQGADELLCGYKKYLGFYYSGAMPFRPVRRGGTSAGRLHKKRHPFVPDSITTMASVIFRNGRGSWKMTFGERH